MCDMDANNPSDEDVSVDLLEESQRDDVSVDLLEDSQDVSVDLGRTGDQVNIMIDQFWNNLNTVTS